MEGYDDGYPARSGAYCLNAKDNMSQPGASVPASVREAAVASRWDGVPKLIAEYSVGW